MQGWKPGGLSERPADHFGTKARTTHAQQQDVLKLRVPDLGRTIGEAPDSLLLIADDVEPTEPLVFICTGPNRRVLGPEFFNFSARVPVVERSFDRTGEV